ncbi:MAG TPA: ABC transporter permease [Acidobacteriaceae bacterium]|nr:ABC transporter permease [Acidobacteriaceae bacterium]
MNRYIAQAVAKLRNLVAGRESDADFDREFGTHLAFLEDEFLRRGLAPAAARRAAKLECGSLELTRQSHRDGRAFLWLTQAAQDIQHALRSMRRLKGFTVAAILTLALGVGANTAVFSVVDAVLLKPLNYPDPDRIVQFFLSSSGGTAKGASIPDLRFWQDHANSVEEISAFDFGQSEMGLTSGAPEQVHGIHVTSNYLRLFGASLVLGRGFNADEDSAQGPNVVVLSYKLWKRRFAADDQIVGRAISLDKDWYTVIGVTGEGFRTEPEAQLWIPFHFDLSSVDKLHSFGVAARLKPGITLAQANAQLDVASEAARRASKMPDPDFEFKLRKFSDAMVSYVRPSLLLLQAAVILVLLIACTNLANLLLMRMTVRKREFAIRGAMGAGRGRILRQLIVESLLLCSFGCAVGVALGLIGARALLIASPNALPHIGKPDLAFGLDRRVLVFAAGLSLLTTLFFGLLPALDVCREGFENDLREAGARQGTGARSKRAQSVVVVSEVALSLVLLIGATLLIRTFICLSRAEPGFDSHHVVLMTMPLHDGHTDTAASATSMVRNAHQELAAIPGVEGSAATFSAPYASRMGLPFTSVSSNSTVSGDGEWMAVSPGYFGVLKIPILRGRDFNSNDNEGAPAVVLINEAMARRFWAGRDPIGQQILIGKDLGPKFKDTPRQVIGIVGDTRDDDLSRAPEPTMIIPDAQEPDQMVELETQFGPMWWLIRTHLEPKKLISAVSEPLRRASGGRPVGSVRTMDDVLSDSIAKQKFNMLLLSVFALIALLLAALGVYSVMAYSVTQRTHEIGVRMALGAARNDVRNMVLHEGAVRGVAGMVCGMCAAFFLVRLLADMLYGVSMRDPAVFFAVPAFMVFLTAVAAWIPARRAARLDPVQALRFD